MPIDIATLTIGQLENLIQNHRRKRATDAPLYVDALRELEKRRGKGLDFDKSLSIILEAARERRFLSYKELADASGADWGQVHYAIGEHLWKLVEYADRKGWPLLSSIVVNKPNVNTGRMDPETLRASLPPLGCLKSRSLTRRVSSEKSKSAYSREPRGNSLRVGITPPTSTCASAVLVMRSGDGTRGARPRVIAVSKVGEPCLINNHPFDQFGTDPELERLQKITELITINKVYGRSTVPRCFLLRLTRKCACRNH
jgi:hypothetical protein